MELIKQKMLNLISKHIQILNLKRAHTATYDLYNSFCLSYCARIEAVGESYEKDHSQERNNILDANLILHNNVYCAHHQIFLRSRSLSFSKILNLLNTNEEEKEKEKNEKAAANTKAAANANEKAIARANVDAIKSSTKKATIYNIVVKKFVNFMCSVMCSVAKLAITTQKFIRAYYFVKSLNKLNVWYVY